MKKPLRDMIMATLASFIGFSLIFSGLYFHFWAQMSLTTLGLAVMAYFFDKRGLGEQLKMMRGGSVKTFLLGILSSVLLYLIFLAGYDAALAFFEFGKRGIAGIYGFAGDTSPWIIGVLLLLFIGPGEEIFWRGYYQRKAAGMWGRTGIIFSILVYALVHTAAGNVVLILAALCGGVFWGLMYHHYQNLWANIICHALWDVLIFVVLPFS